MKEEEAGVGSGGNLSGFEDRYGVALCTSDQEAAREEEIFASQRANRGEYRPSLQIWGQI